MAVKTREEGRRKSASMAAVAASERERLARMSPLERVHAALEIGRRMKRLGLAREAERG